MIETYVDMSALRLSDSVSFTAAFHSGAASVRLMYADSDRCSQLESVVVLSVRIVVLYPIYQEIRLKTFICTPSRGRGQSLSIVLISGVALDGS